MAFEHVVDSVTSTVDDEIKSKGLHALKMKTKTLTEAKKWGLLQLNVKEDS